jgi:hypothetical protein
VEGVMASSSRELDTEQRQALIKHITRHLDEQDDQTLMLLGDLTQVPQRVEAATVTRNSISRRRFLTATAASGFVAATAGAVAVWQYSNGRGQELSDDLGRMWGLVRLYEKMDEPQLDRVVAAGIAAMGAPLEALASAADVVKAGAQTAEDALIKFETAFPNIRTAITWLEGLVSDWAQRLRLLEDTLGRALDEVSPLTQAVGGFFDSILKLIPLGGGQKIKEALDRIGEIVATIPQAVADINVKILAPLRDEWFTDQPGKGLTGGLIGPIITRLLDPLEALLGRVSELIRRWEPELVSPTQSALDRREAIRREIAEYKVRFGLHEPQ